ncbi:MAG: hypothetical protein QXH30_02720 [Candidatus Bilamarchaeaceae archaeon]
MEDRPEYVILAPCTTARTIEMRTKFRILLSKCESLLSRDHEVLARTPVFLTFVHSGKQFSLYETGKIVIRDADSREGKPLLVEVFGLLKERGCFAEG